MGSLQKEAKRVVAGLAFWMMLASWAASQEDGSAVQPIPSTSHSQPCERCLGATPCQNCGHRSLALSPENWPPPCGATSCDPCDEFKSCPEDSDYYIIPPRCPWYAVFDGAAIVRNPPQTVTFATTPSPLAGGSPVSVLSTHEFHYDFAAAGRVVVGHTFNECYQLEGGYLNISELSNTVGVADPNGQIFSPFSLVANSPLDFVQAAYSASLQSVELNVRRKIPMPDRLTVSVLFGVRYIGLPEDFDFLARPTTGTNTDIHVATKNEMVGPQIGTRFELYADNRWWMNCEVKAAVLNNRAQESTTGSFTGFAREDHTAFAGDLALTFVYRWSPHVSTHLGYQALWIEGMAQRPTTSRRTSRSSGSRPRATPS